MIEISISLFGRFRRLQPLDVPLRCEAGVSAGEVKALLSEWYRDACFFGDSVLATDEKILRDDERIYESARLALLPPVCGG